MKRISLVLALLATVPLVSTACSKDKGSKGGGDGDGDGDTGDGDGDGTGGMAGDGDGDTGGTTGDGDGDTGGTTGDGDGDTGGMGGFGGDGMGGMGGGSSQDSAALCTTICEVKVAVGCTGEMSQSACEGACAMLMVDGCESEAFARLNCEAGLNSSGWECNPNIGGFLPWYSSAGDAACGDTLTAYNTCTD